MPTLIRWVDGRAALAEDAFTAVADETGIPRGDVIVSLARFQQEGERLLGEGRSVGVRIEANEAVEDLAYDLPRIAVVALVFPKYRQGQAYSSAALLRERYGYRGELRAVGEVLREQARFMVRCGFDAFEPADGSTPEQCHAHPLEIIRAAVETYGDELALVSSFGAESAVLLHLASRVKPDIPVLFLDTGMLFGQTLDYRQQLAAKLGLTDVRDLRPRFEDLAVGDPNADLWKTDTDACCHIRKVIPLDAALGGFAGWLTGRKRFHGGDRMRLPVVEEAGGKLKFNPLANWSKTDLDAYAAEHDLPDHPLVAFGYPSIGCWPCTSPVEEGGDVRSGRWAGSQKTECGIHTARAPGAAPNVGGDI